MLCIEHCRAACGCSVHLLSAFACDVVDILFATLNHDA